MELNENALFAKSYLDIDLGLLSFLCLLIHASNKRKTLLKGNTLGFTMKSRHDNTLQFWPSQPI